MVGLLLACGAVFAVPTLLCRFVLRAGWPVIGTAYALWFGFLLLQVVIGAPASQWAAAGGWMTILAIYLSIPVIVVLVAVLKIAFWLMGRPTAFTRT